MNIKDLIKYFVIKSFNIVDQHYKYILEIEIIDKSSVIQKSSIHESLYQFSKNEISKIEYKFYEMDGSHFYKLEMEILK